MERLFWTIRATGMDIRCGMRRGRRISKILSHQRNLRYLWKREWEWPVGLLRSLGFIRAITCKRENLLATAANWLGPPRYRGYTITLRHTTIGRTPLDEWSGRHRDLWQHTTLTINIYPCSGRTRTRHPSKRAAADPLLDRAVTAIGSQKILHKIMWHQWCDVTVINTHAQMVLSGVWFVRTTDFRM